MFKNFFRKDRMANVSQDQESDVILRLMFEIAMSDGSLDKSELELLKKRAAKINMGDKKPSSIIKEVIDSAAISSSIYPTVTKINAEYSLEQKKEILAQLWQLVAIDGVINHYEENLYFKIAELIKVKRPHANQIKQENS
tara:strand:- start:165 stop:584 length:420 start_codon:yes stop_codon:yes gene_type:complete